MRFPKLRAHLVEVVNEMLNKHRNPTKSMIMNLIAVELAFINTNHPDFIGGDRAITTTMERVSKHPEGQSNAPAPQTSKPPVAQSQPQPAQPSAQGSSSGNNPFYLQTFFSTMTPANQPQQQNPPQQSAQQPASKQQPPRTGQNPETKQRSSSRPPPHQSEKLEQVCIFL